MDEAKKAGAGNGTGNEQRVDEGALYLKKIYDEHYEREFHPCACDTCKLFCLRQRYDAQAAELAALKATLVAWKQAADEIDYCDPMYQFNPTPIRNRLLRKVAALTGTTKPTS